MKKLLAIITSICITSCASILNFPNQRIRIHAPSKSKVHVSTSEKTIKKVNDKYKLRRNMIPKQVTVSRDGYQSRNYALMQGKRPPIYVLSWIPFSIFMFVPVIYDKAARAYNYPAELNAKKELIPVPSKKADTKHIYFNKFDVELKNRSFVRMYRSYKKYLKNSKITFDANMLPKYKSYGSDYYSVTLRNAKKIQNVVSVSTPQIGQSVAKYLLEANYTDESNQALHQNYQNTVYLDAEITNYTINNVGNRMTYGGLGNNQGGFFSSKIEIKWTILDYYKHPLASFKTHQESGQFVYEKIDEDGVKALKKAVEDGIKYNFLKLLSLSGFQEQLKIRNEANESEQFDEITIPSTTQYAQNLNEAVASSVTIKNAQGHGSGFFLSSEGHIVTNYHVVTDTTDLKVIMSDKTEYTPKILRINKQYDLALLKIHPKKAIKPLKIVRDKNIDLVSNVYAVGMPNIEILSQTVSRGIISGVRKTENGGKLIQTDASVNAGNSGGALVTKNAQVVGVVSTKLMGIGVEGVAFAVPTYEVLDQLKLVLNK